MRVDTRRWAVEVPWRVLLSLFWPCFPPVRQWFMASIRNHGSQWHLRRVPFNRIGEARPAPLGPQQYRMMALDFPSRPRVLRGKGWIDGGCGLPEGLDLYCGGSHPHITSPATY